MKVTDFQPRTAWSDKPHPKALPYYLGHIFIYLGLVIVLLVLAWLTLKIGRIYSGYQHILGRLETIQTLAAAPHSDTAQLLAQLAETTTGLDTELDALAGELTPFLPLTPYLGWLPGYGGDLQTLPLLIPIGQDLSEISVAAIKAAAAAYAPQIKAGQPVLPYQVAQATAAHLDLAQAESRLQQHQAMLAQLKLEQLSPELAGRIEHLRLYLSQASAGLYWMQVLPELLGRDAPQTYLILTQNADELRPAGGYINTAGHITFDQGRITAFVMQDSYAIDRLSDDYPYPPLPLYEYMAADYWVLRDAAWSPDFPAAARTALELYQRGQDITANGVFAVDQVGLAYLLQAFDHVQVEGERVTSDNVIALMHRHWAPEPGQNLDPAWWKQRKSFMLALGQTIFQEFEQNPAAIDPLPFAAALRQGLAEKHILLHLEHLARTETHGTWAWDSALYAGPGDYLMVVDANVGFNKASALVKRDLIYQVTLAQDGSGQANARLIYQHQARRQTEPCALELRYDPVYEQNMERCYWNYASLIVPAGAVLSSGPQLVVNGQYLLRGRPTSGSIDITPLNADKTQWSQLFLLPPQETLTLDFAYSLPPNTAHYAGGRREYHLYLQKQPGTLEPAVSIAITLPDGARVLGSQPQPLEQRGNVINYQVALKTDQEISLWYELPDDMEREQ